MAITTGHTAQRPARTAYELLGRVCKAIAAEPERYDQTTFGYCEDNNNKSCQTAFCIGGWIVHLHDKEIATIARSVETRANEILGLGASRGWKLFTTYLPELESNSPPVQGTPAYARAGVRHTRRFMAKYKDHLKARTLKGV